MWNWSSLSHLQRFIADYRIPSRHFFVHEVRTWIRTLAKIVTLLSFLSIPYSLHCLVMVPKTLQAALSPAPCVEWGLNRRVRKWKTKRRQGTPRDAKRRQETWIDLGRAESDCGAMRGADFPRFSFHLRLHCLDCLVCSSLGGGS